MMFMIVKKIKSDVGHKMITEAIKSTTEQIKIQKGYSYEIESYDLANLGIIVMPPSGEGSHMIVTPNQNVQILEFEADATGTYEIYIVTYAGPGSTDADANPTYAIAWDKS